MVSGLAGGLAATFVMSQFQTASKHWRNHHHRGAQSHPPQEQEPATVQTVQAVSQAATGHELARQQKAKAGQAVHYAFGAASGMVYGARAEYRRRARAGRGAAFGTGLWALAHEFAVPALKLSKSPLQEDASAHLYGLASHVVYGVTADAVSRGVRALL